MLFFMRHDDRQPLDLRPITVQRGFTRAAPGSVLIQAGRTTILCTASVEESVPPWKAACRKPHADGSTAEYNMLPGSTSPRKRRDRAQVDGRTTEIQRLIGRSLRAVVDFEALGPRTITIDCDVLEADGGTRTLSITGGFIALADALATIRNRIARRSAACSWTAWRPSAWGLWMAACFAIWITPKMSGPR